ncbi:MAG: hypothetical protein N3A01_08510 [Bacteroidales bacterium]|nr:hypothetical protein [Bacteroidales bacterium]
MKTVMFLIFSCLTLELSSQCHKKDYCEDDYFENFDFRSQSSFSYLSPGDSAKVTVVLYNNQEYRIFVCNDPELGQVKWKILLPERVTKRTVKSIKKDTVITYETNEYGDYVVDEKGNFKIKSKYVRIDTVWNVERITTYKVLYKSEGTQQPYFELKPQKTGSYIISVEVPTGKDQHYQGCVNVYVGRRELAKKRFIKEWSLGTVKG